MSQIWRKIMNYSFWEKYFIESPSEITIIGAGIVGLSTAISIKERYPEVSVKILERSTSPNGASTKNAGFSCFGSVSELLDDIEHIGEEACMEIVKMRWYGLKKLKERVGIENMEYHHVGGTELFDKNDLQTFEKCQSQSDQLNEMLEDHLGIKTCYQVQRNHQLGAFHDYHLFNAYEGIINPVKMMHTLHRMAVQLGVQIFYGHTIDDINMGDYTLSTVEGLNIHFQKLIICTNGFTRRLLPNIEVNPARNQVLMTKPLSNNPLKSGYHFDRGYLYFRPFQDRILLGGGRNMDLSGETTDAFGHSIIIQDYLCERLELIYPGASQQIDCWWSGIMGVGESKKPLTTWIHDDILTGIRLGGMGVAIGSHLGEQLAEKVLFNG